MKMDFVVVIQLLRQSQPMLISGYVAFVLTIWVIDLNTLTITALSLLILLSIAMFGLHHYLYSRVQFDLGLLDYIASNGQTQEQIQSLTAQLDQSLLGFRLMPENKAHRNWSLRFNGCLKLLKIQSAILLIQYIVFFILFICK